MTTYKVETAAGTTEHPDRVEAWRAAATELKHSLPFLKPGETLTLKITNERS